jgi:hypothetical protein
MCGQQVTYEGGTGTVPKEARDIRARCWAYVFECFRRHEEKQGGPATALNDPRKDKDARTYPHCT